jgi:hypothetical protein
MKRQVTKATCETDPEKLPPPKKKTSEQRLREIRRIVNVADEAIDRLHACDGEVKPRSMLGGSAEPDQLSILREAIAKIGMALGPAIDPRKNSR